LGHRSVGAQPHSSRIFQCQAPLGWRSASFFSHFSALGTAGLALSADPLAFFKAHP